MAKPAQRHPKVVFLKTIAISAFFHLDRKIYDLLER